MPASPGSGNPAKRAAAKKAPAKKAAAPLEVTPLDQWVVDDTELLRLPSDKVAKIRRIQLTTLLAEGLLGDSLSALASQAVERGQGMNPAQIQEMGKDPKKIMEAMDAFDRIAARCFVEPRVEYYKDSTGEPIPDEDRHPGVLYSDRLDLNDKIFLFQVISGGSRDLQRFRRELEQSVAGIPTS